jgi:predicted transcriptional regulator
MKEKTKLEQLARLSGKAASKALSALERRGLKLREKLGTPINRVPRREPPKLKTEE